uniref:p-loop containing nucleoside triphosphate hydrolase-like protein n=1 Tax=Tetraselmis sp. GSL018 TaxID=582737 RepID=A0A061QLE9_9CHLO
MAYVPYRNSKLTRLLKDGLSGNSKTAMIATVSCAADQYHHSINTLKYADRAKEIKTHVSKNVGSVESHVSDYQRIIDNLQNEVQQLKAQLSQQESPHANGLPTVPEEEGRAVEASQQQDEERSASTFKRPCSSLKTRMSATSVSCSTWRTICSLANHLRWRPWRSKSGYLP